MRIAVNGLAGEDWLITILVIKVFTGLVWELSWRCCCLAGSLALEAISIIRLFHPKHGRDQNGMFRAAEQVGVFCILLVPLSFLAENCDSVKDCMPSCSRQVEGSFLLASSSVMLMLAPRMLQFHHSIDFLHAALPLCSAFVLVPVLFSTGSCIVASVFGIGFIVACITNLPKLCPRSFTYGELCVVCHLAGGSVWRTVRWMVEFVFNQESPLLSEETHLYILMLIICIFVALATTAMLLLKQEKNTLLFVLLYCVFALMAHGTFHLMTNLNLVVWLAEFVFNSQQRVFLLGWWLLLTMATATGVCIYPSFVANQAGTVNKASTAMRKCFHLVVVAVYIPGLVYDPAFLLLASVVALAVLVILETARLTQVKWLGAIVDITFQVFTDRRDQGPVLLTHIYLLVGLSVPLWLSCSILDKARLLRLSSGILSLGIGDTVACVVGMHCGWTKWPGTCKSLQGTSASIIAQLVCISIGALSGWFRTMSWTSTVLAVLLSSIYEALTSQIDNLVLPLYTMAALPA